MLNVCYSQKRYELKCSKILLEASLDSAFSQVGTCEKTNRNDGEVEKYLLLFNLKKGNPYCAAGQYWCFYTTAMDLNLSCKGIPILKSVLASAVFNDARMKGKITKYKPRKHDLIFWRKKNSIKGHVERIFDVQQRGVVLTIGFNTKNKITGSEGVFLQRRNLFLPLGRLVIRGLVGFN